MRFLFASGSRPLEGFTIKRGIGRGGFGEVYFATSDAGKEVALKHIERNLEVELRGVSQCLNLKHPNLIDLYDIRYDESGDAWVVMEYVSGETLKDTIDRNPSGLPLELVNRWFRGMAAGTAYLHDHGIVHRDLKPGNIFEDCGLIKIGDYGLSKFISTSRRSAQTESVGTFHYMAPEIGKGVYGKEIDIYALGIILFEMLTGRVPFDGESSQEIIMKHLTADPDLSGVPQPYRSAIERALMKDPQKRFQSVAEMVAALAPVKKAPHVAPSPHAQAANASAARESDLVPKYCGASPLVADPPALANPLYGEPLYIGDEDEGIELGPLQIHPEKAIAAEIIQGNGHAGRAAAGVPRQAASPSREPVARATRRGLGRLADWWHHRALAMPIKLLLIVGIFAIAIAYGSLPLAVAAVAIGAIYVVYLGIRLMVGAIGPCRRAPAASVQAAAAANPRAVHVPRSAGWHPISWEKAGRAMLREKTGPDRIGELTGSMLAAAAVAAVVTVAMTAIAGGALQSSSQPLAGPAWLWIATTIGSWIVLAAGKCCEGSSGDAIKRRFLMLALGLAFGAIAYASCQFLMVRMYDNVVTSGLPGNQVARTMYESTGLPKITAFMAYSAAMFATLGWWKQTDPLRASRLRVAPILLAIVAAWLWHLTVLPFPQPWGFMVFAGIAIATQLSASWISPAERSAALATVVPDRNTSEEPLEA